MSRVALLLLSVLTGCTATQTLKDFVSDGCSLFPDGTAQDPKKWCECCYQHDVAYWRGGTHQARLDADEQLHDCVKAKTGHAGLARMMWMGARGGGTPVFPTDYRWGYGWNYGRGYAPLTPAEQALVDKKQPPTPMPQRFSCDAAVR